MKSEFLKVLEAEIKQCREEKKDLQADLDTAKRVGSSAQITELMNKIFDAKRILAPLERVLAAYKANGGK
jgi:hypothetical protein